MRSLLAVFFILVIAAIAFGQSDPIWSESGLEIGGSKEVYVAVELADEAIKLGVNKDALKSRIELQLRRNGIKPGDEAASLSQGYFLYVNLHVVGAAFNHSVAFSRLVIFSAGGKSYSKLARTWYLSGGGTSRDPEYIIDKLLDLVDVFSNEFLNANEP